MLEVRSGGFWFRFYPRVRVSVEVWLAAVFGGGGGVGEGVEDVRGELCKLLVGAGAGFGPVGTCMDADVDVVPGRGLSVGWDSVKVRVAAEGVAARYGGPQVRVEVRRPRAGVHLQVREGLGAAQDDRLDVLPYLGTEILSLWINLSICS